MDKLSIPIDIVVGTEIINNDTLKHQHSTICETIKTLKNTFMDFYENMEEFNSIINSIEKDPHSYTTGKPIIKKYAQALIQCEKLEYQIKIEEEIQNDINLTPQEVKVYMKNYISIFEKQQENLQKQVDELKEVVSILVKYPHFNDNNVFTDNNNLSQEIVGKNNRLLLHCAMLDINNLDYFIKQGLEIENENYSALHYAIYSKNIKNVKKLLDAGVNVNSNSFLYINGFHILCSNKSNSSYSTPLEVASFVGSLEIIQLLIEKGAKVEYIIYKVPNGKEGNLISEFLQSHGSIKSN